ncbi:MAG: hypothetical protein ACPGXK_14435 [Phycisphaerae bacterium]
MLDSDSLGIDILTISVLGASFTRFGLAFVSLPVWEFLMRITGPISGFSRVVALTLVIVSVSWLGHPASVSAQSDGQNALSDVAPPKLFQDFLYYARLGRFTLADKHAEALLSHENLDPLQLLEVADSDRAAVDTLLILVKNNAVGNKAQRILSLLREGEIAARKQPERIRTNIENLGGSPQQKFVAMQNLASSGEYAVPALVGVLHDNRRESLHLPVRDALVAIGKPAVTPLCIALSSSSDFVKATIIDVLGRLGYEHAVPFLRQMTVDGSLSQELRAEAAEAIDRIAELRGRPSPGEPDDLFFKLAERYFDEDDTVRADPRLDDANVWFWDSDNQTLVASVVPTKIFGSVMAMRSCQNALRLREDNAGAISLWLASNIRREGRLGLNVESGDPGQTGETDSTRPAVFPRALYFTQAAGPRYAHQVLARAVALGDASVALGAIEALRITAGEASLIGSPGDRLPLVQALKFPNLVVRTRAALALGSALPRTPFEESEFVIPLLANALTLTGRESLLVVDPDESNLNRVVDALRSGGRVVVGTSDLYSGLSRAREEMQSVNGIFVSSAIASPDVSIALRQMRNEVSFAQTPVVILATASQEGMAQTLAGSDLYAESVPSSASASALMDGLAAVRGRTGQNPMDGDLAESISLRAAETLREIGLDGRTVFDFQQAEKSLMAAMDQGSAKLAATCGGVLSLIATSSAQAGLAAYGIDGNRDGSLRIAMLNALAESSKRFGNMLDEQMIGELVSLAKEEPDLAIRTAASEALGALNIATNKASEIIRGFYLD